MIPEIFDSLKYQIPNYSRISHNYIKIGHYVIDNTNINIDDINKFVYNCFISLFIHIVPNLKFCLLSNDFKHKTKRFEDNLKLLKNTDKLCSLLGDNVKTLDKYSECPICFEMTSTRTINCNHNICVKCFYKMTDRDQVVKCPSCRAIIYEYNDEYDD